MNDDDDHFFYSPYAYESDGTAFTIALCIAVIAVILAVSAS